MAKPKQTRMTDEPLAGRTEREQAEQIEKIEAGLKAADEARFVSDADIEAIIAKFETNV